MKLSLIGGDSGSVVDIALKQRQPQSLACNRCYFVYALAAFVMLSASAGACPSREVAVWLASRLHINVLETQMIAPMTKHCCGLQTFVEKGADEQTQAQVIARDFVPAMMDPILGDYARNVPDAR